MKLILELVRDFVEISLLLVFYLDLVALLYEQNVILLCLLALQILS